MENAPCKRICHSSWESGGLTKPHTSFQSPCTPPGPHNGVGPGGTGRFVLAKAPSIMLVKRRSLPHGRRQAAPLKSPATKSTCCSSITVRTVSNNIFPMPRFLANWFLMCNDIIVKKDVPLRGSRRNDAREVKNDVIAEARNKGHTVHFASLMDLCHLKNSELEPQFQKYKGRVVLRGDFVKDDSGSYAVFTEQGSSASQMAAAKVMDMISRPPGCARQAADAVSAHTKDRMENAPSLFKIPTTECPDTWICLPKHKWPKSCASPKNFLELPFP